MIYHITTNFAWQAAQAAGEYRAPSLESQGFIHCSKWEQVKGVADTVFRGQTGLVLLCIDPARLTAELREEAPDPIVPAEHQPGERFPHLYGALNLDAVTRVIDFPPQGDGTFMLPDTI
jgi:uncharacterized protein (DUF952 family)